MNLPTAGREYYRLQITTTPPVPGWEASFDDGVTWKPSVLVDSLFTWLVAGPDNPAGGPGDIPTVMTLPWTIPTLRSVTDSEVLIRSGPPIILT